MKFLFVTYRWGDALLGGAEIHHRRLVRDLIELGHEVEVWTTTGRDIEPTTHWAVNWKTGYPVGRAKENGVWVRRFPLDACGKKALQIAAKLLQREMEREMMTMDSLAIARIAAEQPEAQRPFVHLLNNWHHVELSFEGYVSRWSYPEAHLAVFPAGTPGRLWIAGNAARQVHFTLRDGSGKYHHFEERGHFDIEAPISRAANGGPDVISIRVDKPWRPLTDHRSLGLYINSIRWMPEGETEWVDADLWEDHRSIARRHPEAWWELLWNNATKRSPRWGKLFDWLRGPRSSALKHALQKASGYDYVIAANLPWSIIPMVARECPLPMLAMPLWHLEDEYYYWPQYIDSLKRAKLVLANTPFAAKRFYKPRGIPATFVGPGVPPVPEPEQPFDVAAWRAAKGIQAGEKVVLSVSRKSPEKRYQIIADAVEILNREPGRSVRFILIGPDLDQRVLPPSTMFLGRVDDAELDAAYRACDLFALMSDTESFGMVLAEAWMRGKPVIANALCGPAASLVNEGVDGLLARDAQELARAIATLIDDPQKAEAMGRAGKEKADREFTQRAATLRLLEALEK